ncbi:hypothetical protein FPV67DRAFT_1473427 [Lyophyllum atratum]|nr:hypothetical protein FPV67DRAFT_1473427 [Lyophyllum atratum]
MFGPIQSSTRTSDQQCSDNMKDSMKRSLNAAGISSNPMSRRRPGYRLSRKERSMIRILQSYDVPRADIAKRIPCSPGTVTNVVDSVGVTTASDGGNDWDFVDDAFRKAYPPLKLEDSKGRTVQPDGSEQRSLLGTTVVIQRGTTSTSGQAGGSSASTSRTTPSSSLAKRTRFHGLRSGGSSRNRAIIIDIESTPEPELEENQPPIPSLHQFLSSLEHDLSDIIDVLTEQDLGTHEKLFALATWPEDELHRLFKEALPQLTVAQRFMLVKGMKKSVDQ